MNEILQLIWNCIVFIIDNNNNEEVLDSICSFISDLTLNENQFVFINLAVIVYIYI